MKHRKWKFDCLTVTIMEKLNIATQRTAKNLSGASVSVKTPELLDLTIPLQYPEIPASPPYNVSRDLH